MVQFGGWLRVDLDIDVTGCCDELEFGAEFEAAGDVVVGRVVDVGLVGWN